MQKKREISDYRARLDKTLAAPELTNVDTLRSLIKKQLCSSSPHETGECKADVLDRRTEDVYNILGKLRSASMTDHEASGSSDASSGEWKLKGDYEDCRVMYREGLEGNPFHTLLVEGYVDGPVEDCLCVSWESSLYKKWWPQTSFPSFKVLQSTCLRKVRIGEQICLVRMKIPWPMSDREAVVHFFLFEYFKDGLTIVLMNTISDLESIGFSTNGFDKNGIPEALNAVRIDVVGGFALQKVTPERSYFRTIADMDIKFDLIPPSLINFISRQLVGNGFRLYKKAVASVAKVDEDYTKALADPLYSRIRQALYSNNKPEEERRDCVVLREPESKIIERDAISLPKNEPDEERKNGAQHLPLSDVNTGENEPVHCRRAFLEIEEEEESEGSVYLQDGLEDDNAGAKRRVDFRRRFCVSPEVEQALGTLERVISMVRKYRPDTRSRSMSSSSFSDGEDPPADLHSGNGNLHSGKDPVEATKTRVLDRAPHDSCDGSGKHVISNTVENGTRTRTEPGEEAHGTSIFNGGKNNPMLQSRRRVCCFAFKSRH